MCMRPMSHDQRMAMGSHRHAATILVRRRKGVLVLKCLLLATLKWLGMSHALICTCYVTSIHSGFQSIFILASQKICPQRRLRSSRGSLWCSTIWRQYPAVCIFCRPGFMRCQCRPRQGIPPTQRRRTLAITLHSHGQSRRLHFCQEGSKCSAFWGCWSHHCGQQVPLQRWG